MYSYEVHRYLDEGCKLFDSSIRIKLRVTGATVHALYWIILANFM